MYFLGTGVPKDWVKAYAWLILASAQSEESAVEAKDILRSKMTAAQVTAAQVLSAELFKRIEASKSK